MSGKRSMKRKCSEQSGFTLIEIIAVLVILAVLAVVAVPKYLSLVEDAKNKAAMGAVAEGMGRVSTMVASHMMANPGTNPAAATIATALEAGYKSSGDFVLGYSASGSSVQVSASATAGNAAGGSASALAPMPQ